MMGREKGKRIGPIQKSAKEQGPGAWCYSARIGKCLTIAELAESARVSVRTIKAVESGKPGAGDETYRQIAKALGVNHLEVYK